MDNLEKLQHLLSRTAESIGAAQAHHQIWFTLKGEGKALPEFYHVMNDYQYVDFFDAINAGTYKLMYIELGCLFDSDDRAASIRQLKSSLSIVGRIDLSEFVSEELLEYRQTVKHILTIRSRLMAHKEAEAHSDDVHDKNGVTPNEIGMLIRKCAFIVNYIRKELFGCDGITLCSEKTERYENATFSLLEALRNGRS